MKNKLKKFVLPAFALFMAVSLAFATEADTFLETGYIQGPTGPIQVQVDCKSEILDPCLFLGQQVYEDQQYTTPMRKSQP